MTSTRPVHLRCRDGVWRLDLDPSGAVATSVAGQSSFATLDSAKAHLRAHGYAPVRGIKDRWWLPLASPRKALTPARVVLV